MALLATLNIDSSQYSLYNCDYKLTQSIDITGRPNDRPRGGVIHFTIASLPDKNLFFYKWMRDNQTIHDGEIIFPINYDGGIAEKHLKFKDAYCIGLQEHYEKGEDNAMTMQITLSAGTITFGDNCEFIFIE